jgi:hypothetical protein
LAGRADTRSVVIALAFEPIFIYIALALAAVIGAARLLLGWVLGS